MEPKVIAFIASHCVSEDLEMESFVFPVPHLEESLISLRAGLRFGGHLSYGQYSWLITII